MLMSNAMKFNFQTNVFLVCFLIICKYVFSKLVHFVNVVFVVQRPIWPCHCNWKNKKLSSL